MFKEFRDFIAKGNVLDLAVAVIMGGAFGSIVTSLVKDIIMPPIGLLLSGVDFSNLYLNLSGGTYASLKDAQAAGVATINYGIFLNTIINFLIVAGVIFLVVRAFNKLKKEEAKTPPPPIEPSKEEILLTEIRDLLKSQSSKLSA